MTQPEQEEEGEETVAAEEQEPVKVRTERGCTCRLPFEFYPQNMGTLSSCVSATAKSYLLRRSDGPTDAPVVTKGILLPLSLAL